MKKVFVLGAALILAACSDSRLVNVYNAIDTNTNENSTVVDKKAAELKIKINEKTGILQDKADSTTAEKEALKETLEAKLTNLVADGKGKTSEALQLQKEIASLKKLIDAAR